MADEPAGKLVPPLGGCGLLLTMSRRGADDEEEGEGPRPYEAQYRSLSASFPVDSSAIAEGVGEEADAGSNILLHYI